jgi:hypothetical protein
MVPVRVLMMLCVERVALNFCVLSHGHPNAWQSRASKAEIIQAQKVSLHKEMRFDVWADASA